MRPITVFVLGLSLSVSLSLGAAGALSVPPLNEYPADWSCDQETRVCAGIAVGGAASCTLKPNFTAACTYTYGSIARAWGPDGEPGIEGHSADVLVTVCSSMSGCDTLVERSFGDDCSWLPLLSCEDSQSVLDGAHTTPVLAMGECVTLNVALDGIIGAQVHGILAPVVIDEASVWFEDASSDGAQVCRLDDGRG